MKFLFIYALLFLQTVSYGQKKGQSLIDSIASGLAAMKQDTNKVKAIAKICETYVSVAPAKGIDYAKSGLSLSESLGYKRGISRFNNLLGLLVGDTGNNIQARVYFERSYVLNKQIGYSFGMISNLSNIGRSYQRVSEYSRALDYFFKALAVAEENKINEQIALVGTNITSSFFSQKNYVKALEYAQMTLLYSRLSNTPNNTGKALFEIGIIKQENHDSAAAAKYIDIALRIYEEIDNKAAIVQVLSQKATLLYPDYQKAIIELLKVQKMLDETEPSSLTSISNLSSLGTACYSLAMRSDPDIKSKYLDESAAWLNRGIQTARETSNAEYLANMLLSLSKTEEEKKNYKPALEHFKSFYSISDSLYSQDKKNELAGLETKHQVTEKDNEIAISQLKLASQQRTLLALIVGLVLVAVIGTLLFWQNKMRKNSNSRLQILNNRLEEANKVKLRFFGILSHDLRGPVSSLANYLHLLKNAPDLLSASEQAASRQQIGQSTADLLQTLETTLLWSKEQMEHFQPEIKLIPVKTLFDYISRFFTDTGEVVLQFSDPDNSIISTDENYLKVIMQNLTSNAIKALRNQTGGVIEWKAAGSGSETTLTISDNGPGMRGEQLKALYSEGNEFNGSTGFGFHLIRDLARAIQLRITADSAPGKGTRFSLSR